MRFIRSFGVLKCVLVHLDDRRFQNELTAGDINLIWPELRLLFFKKIVFS